MRDRRNINKIHVFYRISDNGFKSKIKPDYITKLNCLRNALEMFPYDKVIFNVYVDKVTDETDRGINNLCKGRPNTNIVHINCGNGGYSFREVYDAALKLNDNDFVYFLEDDYIHRHHSLDVLVDGAMWNYTDYVTLYDHPDKYDNNPTGINPTCRNFGENTYVFKTNMVHWKVTNSTTMTFGTFVNILKRDKDIFWKWTETGYPYDYDIFKELGSQGKLLSSPIPSMSTHGETKFLAPFVDWERIANEGKRCCIMITTHKPTLSGNEERAFKRAIEVFDGHRDIYVVLPSNINTEYYDKVKGNAQYIKVNPEWMSSAQSYNEMMCKYEFYKPFEKYEYMLTYQTDCWVFYDALDYFMNLGYDWYGAPWPHIGNNVGNGGLSLRKVKTMLDVCSKHPYKKMNEDVWFCIEHGDEVKRPNTAIGCNFSMEIMPNSYKNMVVKCPMGVHGRVMTASWDKGEEFFK